MQGEMIAVVQMASLADAMSCVRDMHGSLFKDQVLEVKYMVCITVQIYINSILHYIYIYFIEKCNFFLFHS